ncbi:g3767 [Coccomyxa viridis]|uniref:G3767 protein n=1 Tax=Coccomyxa viridis TaxID=1274662 RepID=A0ABP1FNL7_9CHLO
MHSGCPHPDADPQDSPVWTSEERSHAGEAAERAKEGLSEGRERAKYTAEEEAAQRAAEMGALLWSRQGLVAASCAPESSQAPVSRSGSAAEARPSSSSSARGGHGVGSLDVKSVRDPGQHQHSAASLGSASQHSKPSRASIDAYSLLPQPQSPHTSEASILADSRQHREALAQASHKHAQNEYPPQPQSSHAREACQSFRT